MTKIESRPQSQTAETTAANSGSQPTPKPSTLTKKAQLIRLLSKAAGADVASISKRFGWLPHTTRAALSRLRQAGYEISSEKTGQGKVSRYRITGDPVEQNAR